jgi:6-pyruvoyl-tetrahydropterin synthase related domain
MGDVAPPGAEPDTDGDTDPDGIDVVDDRVDTEAEGPWTTPLGPAEAYAYAPAPSDEGREDLADADILAEARSDAQRHRLHTIVDVLVVAACVVFALWHLQPDLLLRDTTPAGGDMGAHVWGPAYLRDSLLPNGQVAGWTGDWYAGFPAYQFYMVLPSLVIVLLNTGVHGWAGLVPAALGLAAAVVAVARWHDRRVRRLALAGAAVGFALVGMPYGVAFKLVSVSGVVTLPIAAYAFGRLAGARFPTPAVLAVATLPFLFYRGFTIYGGNVASTLAGEFAFSMSLSLALLYLGVVFKGFETGRYRALAALLLALTGLCHLIPAFWALGATAVVVAVRFRRSSAPWVPGLPLAGGGLVVALAGLALGAPGSRAGLAVLGAGALAFGAGLWLLSESVRWLTPTLAVGGLLSMWWVGPFYLRSDYLNDMGWEKLPYQDPDMSRLEEWAQHLLPHATADVDLRWVFALAVVGAGLSIALRLRLGIFLVLTTVAVGVVFVVIPEGRLWNGRLLPFYYLTAMMLAGLAVSELVRTVMVLVRDGRREPVAAGVPVVLGVLAVVAVMVGVPLGQLPFSERIENGYAWPRFSPWQVQAEPASFVPAWARWNYSGYEGKDSYREYYDLVRTMDQVGEDKGCGRAFWEYEKELDRYGTPMALMLLPHWTDGCIGSMEGLYFEASATTPFHFLTQVELSTAPSAAQRDLPYGTFDITKGVDHLQMMGVKYYMATSDNAVNQARTNPELTEVAASAPWVIFEVADSEIVSGLDKQPAVVEGIDASQLSWVEEPHDESGRFGGPAIRWFTDPGEWDVPLASSGPDDWQRVAVGEEPDAVPVDEVEVTNINPGDESLSFDVDQVGSPVLVKMSYFPNWEVRGADGPYRVAPNFMVVVPNDTHVELTYGRTWVEWLSYALTAAGIAGLVLLARRPRMRLAGVGRPADRDDAEAPD